MQRDFLTAFLVVMLVASCAGCAMLGSKGSADLEDEETYQTSALPLTAKLRFSDIPVPKGFKLLRDKSFVFQTESARVALLKYSGRAKLADLVDFYKQQMFNFNWELLNVVEYGRSVLNFERGGESCIISIEPRAITKIVAISLAPKANTGLTAEAQKTK